MKEEIMAEMNKKVIDKIKNDILEFHTMYGARKVIEEFEAKILELKNPDLSYFFAGNIQGADIKAHEQVVTSSDDLEIICAFAQNNSKWQC